MKKLLGILILGLLWCHISFAAKFNPYQPGDIVENEVAYGKKAKFPLPPGKFKVAVVFKEREFHDTVLYQLDENGVMRWQVHVYATGRTQWQYWNPPPFCKRTDVYFIKKKLANKKYACWMVNHTRSDIGADRGIWKRVRAYEVSNKINQPDILVYSSHDYSKGSKVFGSSYFYNPELDGIPPPKNLEWATNEFHMQRVHKYPEHEEFLKKFISTSASLLKRFNELNKIKGGTTLNPEEHITQASINTEKKVSSDSSEDISSQLKSLKELLDSGVITQEEFEKGKKKLLNL